MKPPILPSLILAAALSAAPAFAQAPASSPGAASRPSDSPAVGSTSSTSSAATSTASAGQPSEAEMMKMMMQMAELNENHKLLGELAGTWSYKLKSWMGPGEPQESTGTLVRKPMMGGRYFASDVSGKFQMPGPDGKMQEMDFKGMAIEGYDNIKKKFVSSWMDSMGTGILMSEGTYDPGSKTFTYNAECEMMPGQMVKIRETVKVADKDHHTFEWYDNMRGTEAKSMEIQYTRKK